jgi:hypothetical protein
MKLAAACPWRLCAIFLCVFAAAALLMTEQGRAATFRSVSVAQTSGSSSLSIAAPAGAQAGDLLLATIDARVDGWRPIVPPAGWTLVRRDSDGGAGATLSQAVYYHVAGVADPAIYTWTWPVSRAAAGAILAYGGVDPTNPIDAASGAYTYGSAQIVAPAVTTGAENETVVALFGSNGTRAMLLPPGLTGRSDTSAGTALRAATGDLGQRAAGSTGALVASELFSNSSNIGQLVALRDGNPPVNTAAPAIAGTAQVGGTLAASPGTWSGTTPMTDAYQWLRCGVDGGSCTPIAGATAAAYVPGTDDVGSTLRVVVTETNGIGSGSATSAQTPLVAAPLAPLGSALPQLLPQSRGTTYYVDGANGSDANDGLSTASAFGTIQHALDVVHAGQTVLVRGGSYVESPVMSGSGTPGAPITIENYPGEMVYIEPPSCSCDNEGFQFDGASYVRLQGFVIENTTGTSSTNLYVYGGSHHIQIEGNELRYSQDQGAFVDSTTSYVYFLGNTIHDNGLGHLQGQHQSHGLYVEGSHDLIADNVIYNQPYGFGVQLYPSNHDTVVVDNTIVANGHSGIVVGGSGGVYNITIRNNILAFNSSYGVEMDSSCPSGTVAIDHNVVYGNRGGPVEAGCGTVDTTAGNVLADPLFANYAARDLHLQAASPAIGAAMPNWSMPTDAAGAARANSTPPDIGAYEHAP